MPVAGIPIRGISSHGGGSILRWYNTAENQYFGLKGHGSMSASLDYTLPQVHPTEDGQVLSANIDGTMDWVTPAGGFDGSNYYKEIVSNESGSSVNLFSAAVPSGAIWFWRLDVNVLKDTLNGQIYMVTMFGVTRNPVEHTILDIVEHYVEVDNTNVVSIEDSVSSPLIISGDTGDAGVGRWLSRLQIISSIAFT